MAGVNDHENLLGFFPGALTAECLRDGWAEVTQTAPDGEVLTMSARCPACARAKLRGVLQDFIPPRFRAPISIPGDAAEWAARGMDAQGLYLTGQVGTGKTHVAWTTLARWCMATGVRPPTHHDRSVEGWGTGSGPTVIFTRMTDLLDDLRPGDGATQRVRHCQNARLLIIDDIGAEKPSEWTQERIYSVIDHRYANCLPLIVTSNLPPVKLAKQVGDRAASRLAEMCCVVPMTGADRRMPAA